MTPGRVMAGRSKTERLRIYSSSVGEAGLAADSIRQPCACSDTYGRPRVGAFRGCVGAGVGGQNAAERSTCYTEMPYGSFLPEAECVSCGLRLSL